MFASITFQIKMNKVYGFYLKASLPFIVRSIDMFGVIQNLVLYISFLETHIL